MTTIWTDHPKWDDLLREKVTTLPVSYAWDGVAQEMSRALGEPFTADQVRNRARRIGAVRPSPTPIARLAAAKPATKWDELLDLIRAEMFLSASLEPVAVKVPSGAGTPETMVVMVSDVHIGKLVERDVVGETFGYDKGIFIDRGRELLEGILRLRKLHATKGPIPKLSLFFLGDGVDGVDMRRGHSTRVDIHGAAEQMVKLARYMSWLTTELSGYFEEVDLNWEFGNHGRVGEFGVNLPADNWDYVAGLMVLEQLSNLSNVRVNVHTQKYGVYQIGPLVVYAAHGDAIKGGLSSAAIKRHVANQENLHRVRFDLALLGHFHTSELYSAGATKVFMNGAWDGGDDFSVNQLVAASDPVQWAFGVHPSRGVTWTYELGLASRRLATPVLA